jgi:probable HAF family extracellular repeat protein
MILKLPTRITGLIVTVFSLASLGAGQDRPRYRLIDLGTFGGPASYLQNGLDGILSNHGTLVGWANTSTDDPLCLAAPNCFQAHAFRANGDHLTDLGALPGGDTSEAFWTSESGFIVGLSQNGEVDPLVDGFPEIRAVVWQNDRIVDLGTLPEGGYESLAQAVNNDGQIVGFATNTVPDPCSMVGFPTETRAFRWQDGQMRDLGTLGGPDANAELVNDRGQIAGASYTESIIPATGCPELHPFLWENGSMSDLGTLGGTSADVRSLNQRGEVVGFSNLAGDQIAHPFLWNRRALVDLGTLGGDTGEPNWINDRGDVVGKADLPGPAPQLHDAVLWKDGNAIDLGVLPGDSCSNAYFINARGQIVGTSENKQLCSIFVGQHAFLKEPGKPMEDLNTLIPAGGRLNLTYAVAINNGGVIAGFGVPPGCALEDYELCGHAYVLIPCKPEDACTNSTPFNSVGAAPALQPGMKKTRDRGAESGLERWKNQLRQRFPASKGSIGLSN